MHAFVNGYFFVISMVFVCAVCEISNIMSQGKHVYCLTLIGYHIDVICIAGVYRSSSKRSQKSFMDLS